MSELREQIELCYSTRTVRASELASLRSRLERAEAENERLRGERDRDPRLSGITSQGLDGLERRLDEAGVPREEYSAQGGGVCKFTLWGRIDFLTRAFLARAALSPTGEDAC